MSVLISCVLCEHMACYVSLCHVLSSWLSSPSFLVTCLLIYLPHLSSVIWLIHFPTCPSSLHGLFAFPIYSPCFFSPVLVGFCMYKMCFPAVKSIQVIPSQIKWSLVKSSHPQSSQVIPSQFKSSPVKSSHPQSSPVIPSQVIPSQVIPSQVIPSQAKSSPVKSSHPPWGSFCCILFYLYY